VCSTKVAESRESEEIRSHHCLRVYVWLESSDQGRWSVSGTWGRAPWAKASGLRMCRFRTPQKGREDRNLVREAGSVRGTGSKGRCGRWIASSLVLTGRTDAAE
jgi:hypothetical protein